MPRRPRPPATVMSREELGAMLNDHFDSVAAAIAGTAAVPQQMREAFQAYRANQRRNIRPFSLTSDDFDVLQDLVNDDFTDMSATGRRTMADAMGISVDIEDEVEDDE